MKSMRIIIIIGLAILTGMVIIFTDIREDLSEIKEQQDSSEVLSEVINIDELDITRGQILYVPAYSNIYTMEGRGYIDMAVTLSIRNTDPGQKIIISYIDLYDTGGKLEKHFIENPVSIPPMGTIDYKIIQSDPSGGVGANFMIEWVSDVDVSEPVVEAIMMGIWGNQGFAWRSPGRIVQQK